MTTLELVVQKWCKEFMIEPTWPENISQEEILDRYIFPQLQDDLTKLSEDREYYQNRFYMMQWSFRKILKAYGEIAKGLEDANIRFLSEELSHALKQEYEG